ncbi:hypothetical protein Mro03_60840 [Microbispora rosea subsp. rosea]|nr:hypothetical protein Mro03_60840 [Microbispora rosea subsp. rosea]
MALLCVAQAAPRCVLAPPTKIARKLTISAGAGIVAHSSAMGSSSALRCIHLDPRSTGSICQTLPKAAVDAAAHGDCAFAGFHLGAAAFPYSLTAASTRATFVAAPAGSSARCIRSPQDHQ